MLPSIAVMLIVAQSVAPGIADEPAGAAAGGPPQSIASEMPSAGAPADAADPTQPEYVADFLRIAKGKRIDLRDQRGGVATGRLVGISGTDAIVRVAGIDLRVPARHVEQVVTRGDPPWDGLWRGLVIGLALWTAVVATGDSGLDTVEDNPDDFVRADTISMLATCTALGFAFDYLHEAEHTVFVAPMPPGALRQGQSPPAHSDRRLGLRFRVSF